MENIKLAIECIKTQKQFVDETTCKAFDLAISALKKQEQDRWIPVTERLPETDRDKWHTEFIVTTEDGKVLSMDWENTIVRNKPVSRWIWRGRLAPWRVIAWRPLPAPYQEDEA